MKPTSVKKTTFDLQPDVARRLADLKHDLQYDEGFAASEASCVAIVSAVIMNTTAKQRVELKKSASVARSALGPSSKEHSRRLRRSGVKWQ